MSGLIVHDWLERVGGAEKVVAEMARVFPDARLACSWNDAPDRFPDPGIHESWLARTPLRGHKAIALPLLPFANRHLPFTDVDWMLCSTHLFAHHARLAAGMRDVPKYAYVYTPARYIWRPEVDGRGSSAPARAASTVIRRLDRARAAELTDLATISEFVRRRVEHCWSRDARVIYPPVDVAQYATSREHELTAEEADLLAALPAEYVLGASRFVPYKRLDLVVDLARAVRLPVVLAGSGPGRAALAEHARGSGVRTIFVNKPSDPLLRELFARALVYAFPPVEDFGLMPVEAMASGTPVVANREGGAAESVQHARSGALISWKSPAEMREGFAVAVGADPAVCLARAWDFDVARFDTELRSWVR